MNTAIEIEDYGVHRFIQAFGEATATPTTANTPKIRPRTVQRPTLRFFFLAWL